MARVRFSCVMVIALALGAALLASADAAAPRSGRRGGLINDSFTSLLRVEQIQKELKLTEEQLGKVKEIDQKLRAEAKERYAALQEIEDWRKRREKIIELGNESDDKAHAQLREVLSREQMIRLYQIRLQVRGALYALNNQWIAGRLELTDEQKQRAAELKRATREKTIDAFSGMQDVTRENRAAKSFELRAKMSKIRDEAKEQALGILTAEQKKALEKMKGEKLEL